jgi:hypothetical protein
MVLIALLAWPSTAVLWHRVTRLPMPLRVELTVAGCFATAAALSLGLCLGGMRSGVKALMEMGR